MLPTSDETPPNTARPHGSVPEVISRYSILGRIGAGGMGAVYKAHDPRLDRVVALKVPRLDGPPHTLATRVQRFQREARLAAQVLHPHVCPIYDVGEHDGHPFVVMAYVEGESLAARLASTGRYEEIERAIGVIRQVLEGLEAVHACGIVHRDLKPGNIMIDSAGRAILTDFGLARPENDVEHLTSDGVIVGTPSYMAPEQAAGQSDRIGPWSDLYSVGAVLFRMLTGRLPFEGPPLTVLARIISDRPPSPATWRTDLNPGLVAIILKAMAKEPRDRYQSAHQFNEELAGCLQPPRVASPAPVPAPAGDLVAPGEVTEPGEASRPPWRRARRSLSILLLPIAVFVLCGLFPVWQDFVRSRDVRVLLWPAALAGFLTAASLFALLTPRNVRVRNARGETWLLKAASCGDTALAKDLLARGANVNDRDKWGETPLMKAAAGGHTAVVKILLAHGAEVNDRDYEGNTALTIATAKGYTDIADLLQQ
jgi:hypothetical protein